MITGKNDWTRSTVDQQPKKIGRQVISSQITKDTAYRKPKESNQRHCEQENMRINASNKRMQLQKSEMERNRLEPLEPPTETINIGTSMETGTGNRIIERRLRLPESEDGNRNVWCDGTHSRKRVPGLLHDGARRNPSASDRNRFRACQVETGLDNTGIRHKADSQRPDDH